MSTTATRPSSLWGFGSFRGVPKANRSGSVGPVAGAVVVMSPGYPGLVGRATSPPHRVRHDANGRPR